MSTIRDYNAEVRNSLLRRIMLGISLLCQYGEEVDNWNLLCAALGTAGGDGGQEVEGTGCIGWA